MLAEVRRATPVRTSPGNVPRRAASNVSHNHASARRCVKNPVGGRPRSVHAGPSFFWT